MRKISFGEGVERTFALYSPIVGSIKVIRSGRVRRAKLYYLRGKKGKSARIAEKIKKTIGADVSEQINENEKTREEERIDKIRYDTYKNYICGKYTKCVMTQTIHTL